MLDFATRKAGLKPFGVSPFGIGRFDFKDVIGAFFWLTAQTSADYLVAGTTISNIYDRIGSHDASQTTEAIRPRLSEAGMGGKPAFEFFNADSYMEIASTGSLRQSFFAFVFSQEQKANQVPIAFNNRDECIYTGTYGSRGYRYELSLSSTNTNSFGIGAATEDGNPHIMIVQITGTGQNDIDNAKCWVDGEEIASSEVRKTGSPAAWDTNMKFGGSSTSGYDFIGKLAEMGMGEGTLSDVNRIALEDAWARRYGITLVR